MCLTAPDIESAAPYARDAIHALMASGIINGKNGLVEPNSNTTRAEVAVIIKRILDYTEVK